MEDNKKNKTALVLSGGGSRGAYEAGVWLALTELGINIDIVTGASVGAINGAMVCQGDIELTINLWREIETHTVFDISENAEKFDYAKDFMKEIILNRGAGSESLQVLMDKYIDEERIRQSSVDFGFTTTEIPSMKGHYLFREDIPYGQLKAFIRASASAYPAIRSHKIGDKNYIDGGYTDVMPVSMALEKGATKIIAVYLEAIGHLHPDDYKHLDDFTLIKSHWNLGNFLHFDTKNARRLMRLGYLDTMKTYGVFDGQLYAFAKGSFDKRASAQAECAAKIFDLDPCLIYTKASFLTSLKVKLSDWYDLVNVEVSDLAKNNVLNSLIFLKDLVKTASKQTVVIILVRAISQSNGDLNVLTRNLTKLFPSEIAAAKFIYKYFV